MKILPYIILLFSVNCYADNMLDYLDSINDLVRNGEYEEALEKTIWFHNHSIEHDRSIASVRLSFALFDWYKFGKRYPPALTSLKNIRDNKTNLILKGSGTYELFDDVASINEVLSENFKTIELFNILKIKQPLLAKECVYIVEDIPIKDDQLIIK